MKTLSYSIASLLVLSAMIFPAGLRAQGPTVASSFSIENPAGERVTLGISNSGVDPYTIFFPATSPTAGSLFYGTTPSGTTAWLAPGAQGSVLQIGLSGDPEWSMIDTLPNGSGTNTILVWNGSAWVSNPNFSSDPANGHTTVGGDLTVTGPNVSLPAGSISNAELENSSITINSGTGLSGGGTVALGGSITLQSTGLLSAAGTGAGIDVQTTSGVVTIQNTGVTALTAGNGISLSGSTGSVTVTNSGVLNILGTSNQVNVSTVAGVSTLSTPQDIHADAAPTFAGMTLTGLNAGTSNQVLIRNTTTNALETRTIFTLPGGTGTNTALIWNGTNWVENTSVTMAPGGDITTAGNLTVNGASVALPTGSIDNSELANNSVTVNAGTGLSGGGTVALGGSITLNNDGILSVSGTGSGIDVQTTGGAVTIQNTCVTGLTAGNGISLSGPDGNVTVANSGILSVVGTTNQVNVSTVAGVATVSTPQDIDTDAVPTFDGLTLDNLSSGSTATEVVVSNGGALQTRSLGSLVGGSGRISTASATNGGSSWTMTIADGTVTASNSILLTYEDPSGGSNKSLHVVNRGAGTFEVQFSGKPTPGSFVNYYILP